MSIRDISRRHLALVGLYSTRHAVRGGAGLVFLMLVLFFGLVVAHMFITPVETIREGMMDAGATEEQAQEYLERIIRDQQPNVSWLLGDREEVVIGPHKEEDDGTIKDRWAAYLLQERPALLSVVLLVLLLFTPSASVLGSFNQYSGDVGTRGIRYQLLRTERANIYFGRYLGTVLYSAATVALLIATVVVYMGFKLDFYEWGNLIWWGFRGWLAMTILFIPYIALCGWISAMTDSPFASLMLCILAVWGVPLVAVIAGLQWEEAKYIKWGLPWAIQNDLLHHSFWRIMVAIFACFGYATVFATLGYRHFSKRDL